MWPWKGHDETQTITFTLIIEEESHSKHYSENYWAILRTNFLSSPGNISVSNHHRPLCLMLIKEKLKMGLRKVSRLQSFSVVASDVEFWDISMQGDLIDVKQDGKQGWFLGWVLLEPTGLLNLNYFHCYSNRCLGSEKYPCFSVVALTPSLWLFITWPVTT